MVSRVEGLNSLKGACKGALCRVLGLGVVWGDTTGLDYGLNPQPQLPHCLPYLHSLGTTRWKETRLDYRRCSSYCCSGWHHEGLRLRI